MRNDSQSLIEQLRFLLESSSGPRFILAVCEDPGLVTNLIAAVYQDLGEHGAQQVDVSRIHPAKILDSLISVVHAGASSINLIGLDRLSREDEIALFSHLNFHRDVIGSLGIPITLWINEAALARLASVAPDFWSRRTAVIRFSSATPAERIRQLFSDYKVVKPTGFEYELKEALTTILQCEKEISDCLDGKGFLLKKIDRGISELKSAVSDLVRWVDAGRSVDVMLWLWNALRLDTVMQRAIQRWSSRARFSPDEILDERVEVITQMSSGLGAVLEEYRGSIEARCRDRHLVNLRASLARELLEALKMVAINLADEGVLAEAYIRYHDPDLYVGVGSVDQTLRNRAARRLDAYLSGVSPRFPKFFSPDEMAMLKVLYETRPSMALLGEQFGLSEEQATKRVKSLYEKVQIYLGEIVTSTDESVSFEKPTAFI